MDLPLNYILEVIYKNCRRVHAKRSGVYNFECPICNEGKSAGRKRRGFYFAYENYFYCQNCQKRWTVADWIMEVENLSYSKLLCNAGEYDNSFNEILERREKPVVKSNPYSLPCDCINLNDSTQLAYHKDSDIVKSCLEYIKERRLDRAINRPKTFYITLNDFIHKDRLVIPFYDNRGDIVYYQTRSLNPNEKKAKYLSKKNADKTLYGIQNIDSSVEYIFLFEGPIDSMFCRNGVAACGLNLSKLQREQLDKYNLFKKIWVLDNQLDNKDVLKEYESLINRGEQIFLWPESMKKYKDVNELCMATGRDSVPYKLFVENSSSGMVAQMKLKELISLR